MRRPLSNAAFIPLRKQAAAVKNVRKPKAARAHSSTKRWRTKHKTRKRRTDRKRYTARSRRSKAALRIPGKRKRIPGKSKLWQEDFPQTLPASVEPTATYAEGYDMGYRTGSAVGTEEELGSLLPPYTVLPEVSAREIMENGLQSYLSRLKPLLRPEEVYHHLDQSILRKEPLSVVRLGDGELLALAHDTVLSLDHVKAAGQFLPHAGMKLPDYIARDQLAEAVRKADIIGIPTSRLPTYQGLLFPVLRYYGIDYGPLVFTTSTINYALLEHGLLQPLLRGKRVLLIGNVVGQMAGMLSSSSVHVVGVITPVNGFADIPRVLSEASMYLFDIALVASGIPAVVICQKIAEELGKTALDFGHLADKLISGEMSYN
ncbi:GT-D fold domain-containing glycosyltransferase [Paenibacillus sp. KQZ6P-2]|uniref:GT-D fold domain-containing glycosyltransferase n=1 Tax=Paenibacillus mangrovi TaxID=2931978 RepID=A0A9X1WRX5_9BACL|nr:GT-D fold domain-containing glycosyltransferase [Paenibacillus mangrovi]MCJ8013898.1 GT-D fold domain-containing glycosyltransferase [Paenibacillus mangrovi]